MNTPPTRDEVLTLWNKLTDAGFTTTITSITHEKMSPATVFQMSVGPRRLRFTLDDLLEVREMLPEGYTLAQPLDNADPRWQIVAVESVVR